MRLNPPTKKDVRAGPTTEASFLYDPFNPDYAMYPYDVLSKLQREEPIFYSPSLGSWILTRHQTVRSVLRDNKRFSAMVVSDPLKPLCPQARAIIVNSEYDVPPLLVNNDPPHHPQMRKFFGELLRPKRLQALETFARETVDRYIDRMIEAGPPADLAMTLAWDVPALVLFRLIGIPDKDIAKVKDHAESRVALLWGRPTDEEQIRLSEGTLEFYRYCANLVRARMERPEDDFPSDALELRGGDDSVVTVSNIIATTFNLLFAGHETTSSAAANLFAHLLGQPDLWEQIVKGELAIPALVEEGLRYDPPIQAWRRMVKEEVELEGVKIPEGSIITLQLAAANHDGELFESPEEFRPARANAQSHLTFGMGPHFCLGATLARMEIAVMVELLAKRLPSLRLAADHAPKYIPNAAFRGLRRLSVTW
jgi:cytochrome P450